MKLRIIQLSFNNGGGCATAYLYGNPPASNLDETPYLSIDICYLIHQSSAQTIGENQLQILLPGATPLYMRIGFNSERPIKVKAGEDYSWPDKSEYRIKIAHMIAGMVSFAELNDLSMDVPACFRF